MDRDIDVITYTLLGATLLVWTAVGIIRSSRSRRGRLVRELEPSVRARRERAVRLYERMFLGILVIWTVVTLMPPIRFVELSGWIMFLGAWLAARMIRQSYEAVA